MVKHTPMKANKQHTFYTLCSTLILLLGALCSNLAFSFTPTAQQIEMFKSMSPEQQRALASQYGVNLDELGLGGDTAQPKVQDS